MSREQSDIINDIQEEISKYSAEQEQTPQDHAVRHNFLNGVRSGLEIALLLTRVQD